MKPASDITRRCKACADWTHTVCCFAFDKHWRDKSRDGTGYAYPLDEVAEAWRKAGWTPGDGPKAHLKLPVEKAAKKIAIYRQTGLFHLSKPTTEPPPLSDDDY